jgi:DNA repair protein RecO (recombination protein O)
MPFRTKINQKIAYFQPLTILEIDVHKNKGTLENFKEIKISTPSRPYTLIFIESIVMFVLKFYIIRSMKKKTTSRF